MTSTLRRAASPRFPAILFAAIPAVRRSALPLLLATSTLGGCATVQKPPAVNFDDAPAAVQAVEPPAPVRVVEMPQVLPLPGQLKPVGKDGPSTPDLPDPASRVNAANAAARMQPVRNGFI
ncbi:MAG: P-type conjugative transfer protein TrbG, partial [Betaproteobacteria bacterium]|nr:P-type conjugative transfer protein TrbG [Betaproteobacteria bacterium]